MSQNWYFKNMYKNEYVTSSGNGNYSSNLTYDNPLFIIWCMMEKWQGDIIKCFPEHKMPTGNYNDILNAINKTKEYRNDFNKDLINNE